MAGAARRGRGGRPGRQRRRRRQRARQPGWAGGCWTGSGSDEARLAEMARQIALLADAPFPPAELRVRGPARWAAAGRATGPGRCDRRQLRGPPERHRGRRLAVAEITQRGRAPHRGGRAALRRRTVRSCHRPGRRRMPGWTPARCNWSAPPTGRPRPNWSATPGLIPLVILRGSGETTRALAADGGQARGPHPGPRRRRRGALPGPRRGPGAGGGDHHREPGPAGGLQPAEPAAGPRSQAGTSCFRWRRMRCAPRAWRRPCRPTTTRSATSGRWMPGARPP